ncbi:transcriptional regulator of aroF, aroG, tyrA and aromatic amino acid transport [Desulfohalotomaculum tongense]|uniref:sigma 54-interacting transcriptional regulator n=1 Tax=Desulforadius tongensis TaxID=1216062 RepID=UPI001A9C75EA|nr:sigma 54-interacting transcriptional regulator [Desulforadius tongensis]MBM7855926.1 transcriptional regulator of aroF, aroG, tyrA and aromatic amino acid transport [Desulforadius tongensis]
MQVKTLRFRIQFNDRVGIVLDVSKVVSVKNINIISLQVLPNDMYLEIEAVPAADCRRLEKELAQIPEVRAVERIDMMPHEEGERKVKAVLDSVSEGIIAIDKRGLITIFNPVCEKILRCSAEEVMGRHVSEVLSENIPMLKSLKNGKSYDNKEMIVSTPRGRHHYLTTGRPIVDEHKRILGVVATIKDMSQVRDLVYSITQPAMITFDDIIYGSREMIQIVELARRVARSDTTVMIRGESGTGKELFARSIHMASPRRNKPFVPLNCAALPESLLESELFGYADGAFTGAKKGGKQGLFEFANDGTLFLDEIGELPPHLQAKLLRVLQDGKVRRIGGRNEIAVNVRIIAATNRNLEEMLKRGDFRKDLYYRLNVFPISIPPLRERPEDIPLLAQYLVEKFARRLGKTVTGISGGAMEKLIKYSWAGNVRELENVIERAINLVEGEAILPEHIILDHGTGPQLEQVNIPGSRQEVSTLKEVAAAAEIKVLKAALKRCGTVRRAAKALGVSHTTVLNKIKKYNLTNPEEGGSTAGE